MRLINEDDVLEIIERVTNEAVEKKQPKYLIQPRIIAEISGLPTIESEPDSGWISVKDRLPEDDVSILICSERQTISKATYSSDMGRYYIADSDLWYNELDITHWRPLPKPPKGE